MSKDQKIKVDAFISEVCWHYYVNEMTQAEIADSLSTTRLRVNQAIQRAKASGMVKVKIESPFSSRIELQERLKKKYGLQKALVVPANLQNYDHHKAAGFALASLLSENIGEGRWEKIGVSWGMTLQAAIDHLPSLSNPELEIVSIIGGTSKGAAFNSFGIASGFAERLGATYSLLAAPIFLSPAVDRENFLAQELFRDHMEKFENLDVAILTSGDISSDSYLMATGLPKDVKQSHLIAAGAVGDVVGRFLDKDGNDVSTSLNSQTIGIELEVLKTIPEKIMVAAGEQKVSIIRSAILRGLVNTLITDDLTANLLLAHP